MKGILIVWFFCLCYACLAQPFQTSFTVQQNNFPATVVEVNGDYFVAGTTKACQICLASIYLTKLSSNGTVINTWLYSFAQDVRCQRMKPTEDAGFIFVGDTHGLAIYPFVLKVDSLKNIQWTYFDSTYNGVFNDVYVEGNSYVIIGTSFNPSITTKYVKLDLNGNVMWDKTYSVFAGYSICAASDGFLSCHGTTTLNINKINNAGDSIWTKSFNNLSGNPSRMLQLNSNFFISGGVSPSAFLLRLDNSADSLWTHYYFVDTSCGAVNMNITIDSNLILCGVYYDSLSSISNIFMLETDTLGNELWRSLYGNSILEEVSVDAISTSDSSLLILSRREQPPFLENWLIKTGQVVSVESFENTGIVACPNPVTDFLHLSSKFEINNLKLYDMQGRFWFKLLSPGKEIDLSNLPSGIFFIQLYSNSAVESIKIIKH